MDNIRNVNMVFTPTIKQQLAWDLLQDNKNSEILFGGSAGGGKSLIGVCWLIISCLKYPGTRWLMARAVLKDLKASTLLTFFEVCERWNLKKDIDYKYNQVEGVITFIQTGSTIWLKELALMPSDPEFSGLGSREYTGVFIDEGDQVSVKGYSIAKSRIRFRLEEYGLIPKILICTNPCKNFLYYDFYQLHKKNKLPDYRKFIPALPGDNPFLSHHYIENLKKLDNLSKERLLLGNWEYDENDNVLFEYSDILKMFDNPPSIPHLSERYMTIDLARKGKDKTVAFIWHGLYIEKIIVLPKYADNPLKETRLALQKIQAQYHIPIKNIIADEDGLGGGVVDEMGIRGFINNSRALELKAQQNPTNSAYTEAPKHNYANLKSQCYFLLAKYIREGRICVYKAINDEVKALLIEDLEQTTEYEPDKEKKLQIIPKDKIKEAIGRSPDFADALMFRMFFELKPYYKPHISR